MSEFLQISILPLLLTLGGYQIGAVLQKRLKTPICNPILVAVVITLVFMGVTGLSGEDYKKGAGFISWLITPATVCLAIPMYEQLQVVRKNLKAILVGVISGTAACLVMVLLFGVAVGFERNLTISLLPKSVTTAIGVPLSELSGGVPSITTAAIVFTGVSANVISTFLFKLFRLTDPIAKGVALGTSGHVVATAKANEIGALTGAVSSLSLVVAGILTAVIFPLLLRVV